jgi:hypothetical protein
MSQSLRYFHLVKQSDDAEAVRAAFRQARAGPGKGLNPVSGYS